MRMLVAVDVIVLGTVSAAMLVEMAMALSDGLDRLRRSAMFVVVTVAQGQRHARNEPNGPSGDQTAAPR